MPRSTYSDDFGMYYNNSIITNPAGQVLRVDFTSRNEDIRDPYENIIFHCTRIDEDGNFVEADVRVPFGDAILDLPQLGVFEIRGSKLYARYGNSRTVKKGLSRNRVRIGSRRGSSLNSGDFYRLAYQAYNNTGFRGKLSSTSYIYRNGLYYKGSRVGTIRDGNISIIAGLEYLESKFQTWLQRG